MMTDLAQRIGAPRTIAVPFPYGHTLGHAGDETEHRRVLGAALDLLDSAESPGTIESVDLEWPDPDGRWRKLWHPLEPSPIIKMLRGS